MERTWWTWEATAYSRSHFSEEAEVTVSPGHPSPRAQGACGLRLRTSAGEGGTCSASKSDIPDWEAGGLSVFLGKVVI